jgi:hypothetical protein
LRDEECVGLNDCFGHIATKSHRAAPGQRRSLGSPRAHIVPLSATVVAELDRLALAVQEKAKDQARTAQ